MCVDEEVLGAYNGLHRAGDRPAAPQRPRGSARDGHVRHPARLRLQNCPLRTQVSRNFEYEVWLKV